MRWFHSIFFKIIYLDEELFYNGLVWDSADSARSGRSQHSPLKNTNNWILKYRYMDNTSLLMAKTWHCKTLFTNNQDFFNETKTIFVYYNYILFSITCVDLSWPALASPSADLSGPETIIKFSLIFLNIFFKAKRKEWGSILLLTA